MAATLVAAVALVAAAALGASRDEQPQCADGCPAATTTARIAQAPVAPVLGRAGTAWNAPLPPFTATPRCPGAPRRAVGRGRLLLGTAVSLQTAGGATFCRLLAQAVSTGSAIVRDDLSWADVEPTPGSYRWGRYDASIGLAATAGLTVLPIIDRTPAWTGEPQSALPSGRQAYAAFVARVVARYGPGGTFWRGRGSAGRFAPRWFELWNEPYFGPFANLRPDPRRYARLVRDAVVAGRRANPAARYLAEVEVNFFDQQTRRNVDWVSGMFAAVPDLGSYVDAWAAHPYSQLPPAFRGNEPNVRQQTRRIVTIHQSLLRHVPAAPMWITEIGWPTCTARPTCVSEAQQRSDLVSLASLLHGPWRFVHATVIYQLSDRPGDGPEEHYGLLRADGSPKPIVSAFVALAKPVAPR